MSLADSQNDVKMKTLFDVKMSVTKGLGRERIEIFENAT